MALRAVGRNLAPLRRGLVPSPPRCMQSGKGGGPGEIPWTTQRPADRGMTAEEARKSWRTHLGKPVANANAAEATPAEAATANAANPTPAEAATAKMYATAKATEAYQQYGVPISRAMYEAYQAHALQPTAETAARLRALRTEAHQRAALAHAQRLTGIGPRANESAIITAYKQAGSAATKSTTSATAAGSAAVPKSPSLFQRLKWVLIGAFAHKGILGAFRLVAGALLMSGSPPLRVIGSLLAFLVGAGVAVDSLDGSKPEPPLAPTPLPPGVAKQEASIPVPNAWKTTNLYDVGCHRIVLYDEKGVGDGKWRKGERTLVLDGKGDVKVAPTRVAIDAKADELRRGVEHALHETAHSHCVGRDGTGRTRRARVVRLERVENMALWKAYWHRKRELVDAHHAHNVRARPLNPPCALEMLKTSRGGGFDADHLIDSKALNEQFLFHGTGRDTANIICDHGYDERVASLSGMFGAGIYFADQSCKAAQYATKGRDGVKVLLLNRVALGDPYYATGASKYRRPPERGGGVSPGLTFDAVVANSGGTQAHRELIVYDHRQVYPEYVVHFQE